MRTDILLADVAKREQLGRLYWGFFRGDAHVKHVGPWAEPKWYLSETYLPYAHGGGYILSAGMFG